MSFRLCLCVLLLLCIACLAQQDLRPQNQQPQIRDVAGRFILAMAEGQFDQARRLFAGEDDDEQLMEAYVDAILASQELRKSLADRYGRSDWIAHVGVDANLRNMYRQVLEKPIDASGEEATMPPGTSFDNGLLLRRIDGEWRVISMSCVPNRRDIMLKVLPVIRKSCREVSNEIDAGQYETADTAMNQFLHRIKSRTTPLLQAPASRPAAPPTLERLAQSQSGA